MRCLVTGSAGFIGFHLSRALLGAGHQVVGFDGLTPYYAPELKKRRHAILEALDGFTPVIGRLEDRAAVLDAARRARPDVIVHLAAQAGVRHSAEHPEAFVTANLVGSFHVLEAAREVEPDHLLLASTSSVYGACQEPPFVETGITDRPLSFYAATKKSMEAMGHAWASLHALPTTACRFFTVYGPWGRPDMALFKFVDAILNDRPITVFGEGDMRRDLTYVDDVVEAMMRLIPLAPSEANRVAAPGVTDTLSPVAPFRAVNIAGARPVALMDMIAEIERALGRKAVRKMAPMQPGDMRATEASPALLEALTGYRPSMPFAEGARAFVDWYRNEWAPAGVGA